MEVIAERKISIKTAKMIVRNYLCTLGDLLDISFKKTRCEYETRYTISDQGQRTKVIGRVRFLEFKDLLELGLKSLGYNVISLEQKPVKNFECYVLTYGLEEKEKISR